VAHAGVGCAYYGPACNTRGHTHVDHRVWVQVCVHVCVGTFDGDQSLTVMATSRGCVCTYHGNACNTRGHTHVDHRVWVQVCVHVCVCMCVYVSTLDSDQSLDINIGDLLWVCVHIMALPYEFLADRRFLVSGRVVLSRCHCCCGRL
jgi:hypothetical protein